MKKRILSILLTLCMVLCLVPITVFAAGGAKAILPGTSAQSILKIDKSRLSFAGHEWWVIGQKTDKSNNAPIITLIAVNNDFGDVPFRTGSAVPFENARRYSEDNGYYANNPSDMSQWRKPNEYAGSTLQQKMVSLAEAIPEKEQAVIRPKDITEGITGQEVKSQKLWAFSQEDSIYLYRNSCKYAAKWWTRSSNEVYGYGSWTIHPDGRSGSALNVDYDAAVRPAMELDLSSVLFISAAEHGKVADLTTPIAEYAGDEWKLTLHDSDRDDFTAKTVLVNGSVLEVEYKNAKVGDNEYISAVIKDADGSISRYTRVVQLDGTTNGTRGRAAIDLTGIDMTGKTLCVFNEQFNGDHKTDYAGALREVKLTDEIDEQFTLTPGGTYYFDLSGANIPGTANGSLPDSTLHYVPFTYTGTVYAYSLSSNSSGVASSSQAASTAASSSAQYGYARDHSLFIADYAVAHTVSWLDLNAADLIFGKDYASGKISYALRAPSVGSNHKLGSDADEHGDPENNEWDAILNKARQDWQDNTTGYIKNWKDMYSTGQDTAEAPSTGTAQRMKRGYPSVRRLSHSNAGTPLPYDGFRPVLEVLNPGTLGPDGLKVVTLDLGGGKLGGSSEDIQIIVKNGSAFTAPASGGLTRPDGNTGSYFMWLDGNGNSYEPGSSVPADVTELTVQWTAPTYTVTLHANGGTIADGKDVTGYTYGVGATLPTDVTRTGYTFKGWYDNENLTGSPVTAISNTETGNKEYWAKWEINQYTITFDTAGGSTVASITQDYGTAITAPADPTREGYTFIGWDKAIPTTMPAENMTITAKWKVNQYTITFDSNGGSEIAPITQDYGTAITVPSNPTREGYTFIGWDKEIPATMPAENVTITAKWAINKYTIRFNTDGGTYIFPITADYGSKIHNPGTLYKPGFIFDGWDRPYPETMPAENITLTAKWKVCDHSRSNQKASCKDAVKCSVCKGFIDIAEHTPSEEYKSDGSSHWHVCTVCGEKLDQAEHTGGKANCHEKAKCDICHAPYGEVDTSAHHGGKATCSKKAVCDECGKEYGNFDPANHAEIIKVNGKNATAATFGTKEHYKCSGCGKLFSDGDGKTEVTAENLIIGKLPPKITEGDGNRWVESSEKPLAFRSDAAFEDFTEVLVDGEKLSSESYAKFDDGIKIELLPEYLGTLSEGAHTITIRSEWGEATAEFSVEKTAAAKSLAWLRILIVIIVTGGGVTAYVIIRKKKNSKKSADK